MLYDVQASLDYSCQETAAAADDQYLFLFGANRSNGSVDANDVSFQMNECSRVIDDAIFQFKMP